MAENGPVLKMKPSKMYLAQLSLYTYVVFPRGFFFADIICDFHIQQNSSVETGLTVYIFTWSSS